MAGVNYFLTLPSSIVMLIVSFLPFKEAARTSVLSKQWQHIWRCTKNMEFNENFFVRHDDPVENQTLQRMAFIDFIRRFIAAYSEPVINCFVLMCSKPHDFLLDMQNIITFATSHNVRDFALDFSDPTWRYDEFENHNSVFELPVHVYNLGAVLKSLKLYSCNFDVSRLTHFSGLNNLSLGWIKIPNGSLGGLLNNCPMLESLSLKKCWNINNLHISRESRRLKNLAIERCDFREAMVYIDGPRLRYFKYSGKVCQFYLEGQGDMVEADIDLGMESEFDEIGALLYELLANLYAVRVLTVCSVLLQIVPSGDEPLGMRPPLSVKHLTLTTALHANEFCGIMFMLRSCPTLQTLTIDIGPAIIFPDYEPPFPIRPNQFWSRNPVIQRCISRTLKVVNVKGFKGIVNELDVLRYIVNRGRVLEQLNIHISKEEGDNGENQAELYLGRAQQVLGFIRASPILRTTILS